MATPDRPGRVIRTEGDQSSTPSTPPDASAAPSTKVPATTQAERDEIFQEVEDSFAKTVAREMERRKKA